MDLGAAPRHSHRLIGLLPSTSPPPLGERLKQSGRTNTHFDSHTNITMSHTSEGQEGSPYPPIDRKSLPENLYGTPEDLNHFVVGTSHDVLSQFPDYINSDCGYWSCTYSER